MDKKVIGAYLGLFLVTLIVGLSFFFVKIGLEGGNSYDLLAHRFTAALVALFLLRIFGVVKVEKMEMKEWGSIILVSLFYPILCFGFQTVGLEYSTASQAGIIFALLPVLTLIAGSLFLKEKSSLWQKVGIGLSLAGLAFISFSGNGGEGASLKGTTLLLLSVLSMVAYYMAGKRVMQRHSSITLTSAMVVIGFIIFNSISLYRHMGSGGFSSFIAPLAHRNFLIAILYLGVLSSLVTTLLSNYALIHISTAQVSIFNNISPIIAILSGVLFLGESLVAVQIFGGVAVLGGVALVLFKR